jgi:phosphonate transport system permease protein
MTKEMMLKKAPKKWIINLIFLVVMLGALIYSFTGSSINWTRLSTFWISLDNMIEGFTNIQIDFLIGQGVYDFNEGVIYLTIETLAIAFIATLLGAILSLPISFLASKNIVGDKISKFGEGLLVLIRVFPEIILALVLVKGFGINPLTGVLAIGIHSIGMIGKLFSETIDNMDKAPLEALDAVGANVWVKIRYGVLPQVTAEFSSIALYRLDINVRSATVLGIIGAGGIGSSLILASENWNWDILGTIMVAIIFMVVSVDIISSFLRKKIMQG